MCATLRYDVDFDNAVFFAHYVIVMMDGEMLGGGSIEGYDSDLVWMNGQPFARTQSSFIQALPPEMMIDFPIPPNQQA